MERSEIFERLNEIFQDIFDSDDISVTETTTANDVEGWDSLTHISLIAEVEEEFGIKFAMKDVVTMKNVGEMADLIAAAL